MSGNRGRARVSVRGRPSEISQGKCARSRVKRARERQIWAEQSRAERSCELRSAKSSFSRLWIRAAESIKHGQAAGSV